MNKSFSYILAVATLLCSCAQEPLDEDLKNYGTGFDGRKTVIKAVIEKDTTEQGTKTSVDESSGAFSWQEGDAASFTVTANDMAIYSKGSYSEGYFTFFGALSESPWTFYPYDLTADMSASDPLKIIVPQTRVWAEGQTNASMYGTQTEPYVFNFKHLGGLARVRIENVSPFATKLEFKAPGKKIVGLFDVVTDSDGDRIIRTGTPDDNEDTYTVTFPAQDINCTMDFYIPLPVGTYDGGFSVYLKDMNGNVIEKREGTTVQTVDRADVLLMPAITLAHLTPLEENTSCRDVSPLDRTYSYCSIQPVGNTDQRFKINFNLKYDGTEYYAINYQYYPTDAKMAIMDVRCKNKPVGEFEISSWFVDVKDPSKTYSGLTSGYEMQIISVTSGHKSIDIGTYPTDVPVGYYIHNISVNGTIVSSSYFEAIPRFVNGSSVNVGTPAIKVGEDMIVSGFIQTNTRSAAVCGLVDITLSNGTTNTAECSGGYFTTAFSGLAPGEYSVTGARFYGSDCYADCDNLTITSSICVVSE